MRGRWGMQPQQLSITGIQSMNTIDIKEFRDLHTFGSWQSLLDKMPAIMHVSLVRDRIVLLERKMANADIGKI